MKRLLLAALVSTLLGAIAAPLASAAIAPKMGLRSVAVPTYFKPGDTAGNYGYEILIANEGGGTTSGSQITVVDELPEGVQVEDIELLLPLGDTTENYASEFCETATVGASETVTCRIPQELPDGTLPALLGPNEGRRLIIFVTVPVGTPEGEIENTVRVQGGGSPANQVTAVNRISSDPVPAGFQTFTATLSGEDGEPVFEAGSHPYQYNTGFAVNTKAAVPGGEGEFEPAGGDLRTIEVALPPGLVGDPTAVARCTPQQFNTVITLLESSPSRQVNSCPDAAAVGLIVVQQVEGEGGIIPAPIYNMVPPKGMPAQFGFQVANAPFYINTKVRTGSDYGITAFLNNVSEAKRVTAASVTFWGTPADKRHDPLRGFCLNQFEALPFSTGSCPAGLDPQPFFRLPTNCAEPQSTQMLFNTWSIPLFVAAEDEDPALENCSNLDFQPTFTAQPQVKVADSPTGLSVHLHLPQSESGGLGEADLRNAVVTLPKGVTINPASAAGLQGCSSQQIGLDSSAPASCPDAAKVGSVSVHTPLLDHPVEGSVYVATQNANPFNSLIAIYIAAHDPESGVVIKLAGHVEMDPVSGQVKATFEDNPQLPFEDFVVTFFDGPRAPLRTPSTCGTYSTETSLTPWSAPASGPPASSADSFGVTTAPGGGPCAASEAALPHRPAFSAGTVAPVAGQPSPFLTNLSREDGSQTLTGLNVHLPQGVLAKLAGVSYCPEAAIAAASGRTGQAELASPSCPPQSRVGTVTVGAGAGPSPLYVKGSAYLAGPYKGAPLSLAILTPAVAGPFDLGTVAVRAALQVDPNTALATVVSDPFPTILQGIPLDVRSVAVSVDRPDFTRNPTSCAVEAITAEAISLTGQAAPLSERFQAGGCRGLDFGPRLNLRFKGATKRATFPAVQATLTAKLGEANISRAVVTLPPSQQIENAHINNPCTRVQFNAGSCPPKSILGYAEAKTPLLDEPLRGPVYFRSNGGERELPDIVADLNGQIRIILVGYIDSVNGGVRTTFASVPDAPVSKFSMNLFGGKRGLLVNNRNICAKPYRAKVRMVAHSGKAATTKPVIATSCGKKKSQGSKRR